MQVSMGDRVRFGKRDKHMEVSNGDVGVVTACRRTAKGLLYMEVRLESEIARENGRVVQMDTGTYNSVVLGYGMTVHKSQGLGKQQVFHLANPGMADNQSSLVAFTRGNNYGWGDSDRGY